MPGQGLFSFTDDRGRRFDDVPGSVSVAITRNRAASGTLKEVSSNEHWKPDAYILEIVKQMTSRCIS